MKEAKKIKCSKRLICEQYFQVSSLCGSLFPSYLPIRVTRFYRALYGDVLLVFVRSYSAEFNAQLFVGIQIR